MHRFQARRQVLRCLWLIVQATMAILCLFGKVGTVAHLAFVPHEICVEHGEWVHGNHVSIDREEKRVHEVAVGTVSVEASHTEDDHCFPASTRLQQGSVSKEIVAIQIKDASQFETVVLKASFEKTSISDIARSTIYRIAPKTSPPLT